MKVSINKLNSSLSSEQLEDLVRLYSVPLMRYFKKRGCQKATVDDLVQDVFARLSGRASGGEIENPEAYIMKSASGVWKDFLRKRQTHFYAKHVEYDDNSHALKDFSPEHIYECKETIERLLVILNELPERTRNVFVLCRIEGMKQKVVAKRLGISVSSVEKHVVKAIITLTNCLGQNDE